MQLLLGWVILIFPGVLFAGQLLSVINFRLAQKLGLQEDPAKADPLLQRAERYVAFWDLLSLPWLPLAGLLMIIGHHYWPLAAIVGGAIYMDAAGREAVKMLSFSHQGLAVGSPMQARWFFITYIIMFALGMVALVYAVVSLVQQ